jgi:hypothetical protein
MIKILFLFLMVFSAISLSAQDHRDTLEVRKNLFLHQGKTLKPKELINITRSNPEAYKEMRKAKSNYDVAVLTSSVGGFLVGWPLGTAIGGGDPNWAIAGAGAGLIVLSLPLSSAYFKRAKNAVKIYNEDINRTGKKDVDLKWGINSNGIGIKLIF